MNYIESGIKPTSRRKIIAESIPGKVFRRWVGDIYCLDNPNLSQTYVTMPAANVTVIAEYWADVSGSIDGVSSVLGVIKSNGKLAVIISGASDVIGVMKDKNLLTVINGGISPVVIEDIKYGLLYNWYAATDVRNIASIGWHVPSESNVNVFRLYVEPGSGIQVNTAGAKLKDTGLTYWNSPNTGATNQFGFNGRGSGLRSSGFSAINQQMNFFTSYGTSSPDVAGNCVLFYDNGQFWASNGSTHITITGRSTGQAIRLLKDSTTLTHGQTGIYIGNDGKMYRTICIGTQEWLADNLAETKYRNGDLIPEVTNNVAWTALTTGALCAYNNDWNNV